MRRNLLSFLIAGIAVFSMWSCQRSNWEETSVNPDYLHRAIKQVTDVMVYDVYSPPVASRTYAYASIAGYEAARSGNPDYISFAGQLHGLVKVPTADPRVAYSPSLASVKAVLTVGKAMVVSEDRIAAFEKEILDEFEEAGMPEEVIENSLSYGQQVAAHVLEWASTDNYKETRSFPKYSISEGEESWKPTPPSYMKAVEPEWNKIRPFIIDSAQQFKPEPPTPFDKDANSRFFREAKEVYDIGLQLSPEQGDMANFWDCNPFKMNVSGHVMFATKKISPGGHWINIARLASRKAKADFIQSAETYAYLSITLADSFISCWDEKYRSRVIRPETYINKYIDQNWTPLLQTPPFPEYTSGHSVVSVASSVILTNLFGDNFSYADSTQVEFNIPVRHFKSFEHAAEEASISRLYGGIHYRPSIEKGMQEGKNIGSYIVNKLKTRKGSLSRLSLPKRGGTNQYLKEES